MNTIEIQNLTSNNFNELSLVTISKVKGGWLGYPIPINPDLPCVKVTGVYDADFILGPGQRYCTWQEQGGYPPTMPTF